MLIRKPACLVLALAVAAVACFLPAAVMAQGAVQVVRTAGGIEAWLVEERSIPLVSMRFSFAGGALDDPSGREGLSSLMAALLTEGAGQLDAEAFARRLADEGTQISISGSRDRINGGLDALTKRLEPSAELLAIALAEPRLDMASFERARQQRLAELELAASDPRRSAFERWWAETFPADARGRPVNGTSASVNALTRDDVVSQHRKLLVRSTLKVVIVGDVDRDTAARLVDRTFGRLPAGTERARAVDGGSRRLEKPVVVPLEAPLTTAAFGSIAPPVGHPDYPALQVLNQVIGSGDFDSTLMEELRVKRGLAYSVSTSLIADSSTSIMLGGMATRNESIGEALDVLRLAAARIVAEGPTEDQFSAAKSHLTGSFVLDLDTNAKLASFLLRSWDDGRGPEYRNVRNAAIDRVSLDDVKRVAAGMLAWDRVNLVVVGRQP